MGFEGEMTLWWGEIHHTRIAIPQAKCPFSLHEKRYIGLSWNPGCQPTLLAEWSARAFAFVVPTQTTEPIGGTDPTT
jgi:hypothetical protein